MDYSNETICSPAFIYNSLNGGKDNGLHMLDAFNLLKNEGCLPLSIMPYKAYDYTTKPPEGYDDIKEQFKIEDFTRLTKRFGHIDDDDIDSIRLTLSREGPVVIGALLSIEPNWNNLIGKDNSLNKEAADRVLKSHKDGNTTAHSMVVVGFDDDYYGFNQGAFKIMNSWGPNWKEDGFFWMSYEAFKLNVFEVYRMVRKPSPPVEIVEESDIYNLPIKMGIEIMRSSIENDFKEYDVKYNTDTQFFSVDYVFQQRDRFRVLLETNDNYSAYFVNITPSGRITKLLPRHRNDSSWIYANIDYAIPNASSYFTFGGDTGRELFVMILSQSELTDNDVIIRGRINTESLTSVDKIKELVYSELSKKEGVAIYAFEIRSN